MIPLAPVPRGIAQIIATYGDPDGDDDYSLDAAWFRENIIKVAAPYPMRVAWNTDKIVEHIQCHRAVAASLVDALTAIRDYQGEAYLYDHRYDLWGGCFAFRQMRGYQALSVHSWGCAVDVCPDLGRFGNLDDALTFPPFIVSAFESRGWRWGGRWRAPWNPDAMHFQACSGY